MDLLKISFYLKIWVWGEAKEIETNLNPRVLPSCKKNLDTVKAS